MSDIDDAENETEETAPSNSKGPKALRDALAAANAKVVELEAENTTFKKQARRQTVAQALEKHGAKPSLAKYFDKDEASDDVVLAWLTENGEDFGWSPDGADDDDAETMEEAGRIGRASTSGVPSRSAPRVDREFIRTAPREELIKMGILHATR